MATSKSKASGTKSGIKINPANKGKLRAAAGVKKGKNIPASKLQQMKNSPNPTTRKRANFAANARKWNKG